MSKEPSAPDGDMDDEIERLLREESFRLTHRRKMEEARFNLRAAQAALSSPERRLEFQLLAKMSRMIHEAYLQAGFAEDQAMRFSIMITQHTMYNGLEIEEEGGDDNEMSEEL